MFPFQKNQSTNKKKPRDQKKEPMDSNIPCRRELTNTECEYYFIRYPDVLNQVCGGRKTDYQCARKHWTQVGCKKGLQYELPSSCNYNLTDAEAICYIKQNNLDFKPIGNDLNKARQHWREHGCIENLSYMCPQEKEIFELNRQLTQNQNELKDLGNDYQKYVENADADLKNILKLEVTSLPFVFNSVHQQNEKLKTQLSSENNEKLTNNQSAIYGDKRNESLHYYNTILFWIYYIVVFIFAGVLFLYKKNMGLNAKIFMSLFFVGLPYFIYSLEYWIWFASTYIISMVYSRVFSV